MPETMVQNDSFGRDVMVQAFLYANGELEGTEALSFERRLGEDQAARDALCQAVLLCQPLAGPLAARPNPIYRERVRQRLGSGPQNAENMSKSCLKMGHPALWGIVGAVAATLLTLALQKAYFLVSGDRSSGANVSRSDPNGKVGNGIGPNLPGGSNPAPATGPEVLNRERARTAQDEDSRRKARSEDSRRQSTPPGQRPRAPAHHALTN